MLIAHSRAKLSKDMDLNIMAQLICMKSSHPPNIVIDHVLTSRVGPQHEHIHHKSMGPGLLGEHSAERVLKGKAISLENGISPENPEAQLIFRYL